MLDTIKNFILDNWQLIVAVIVFVLSFILQLIKKKPVTSLSSQIYAAVIAAVNKTENDGVLGSQSKLAYATTLVVDYLKSIYPDLDFKPYLDLIRLIIEDILSTPQKKGVRDGEKKTNG